MSHPRSAFLDAHLVGLTLPGGRRLFGDLSLSCHRERTGLVGANGVGKTLLLEILVGLREPTEGSVLRDGVVGWVPQGAEARTPGRPPPSVAHALGLSGRLARLDRVLAGQATPAEVDAVGGDWDLRERVGALLDEVGLAGLGLDRPMDGLSGGEATRVRLLRPLLSSPDLLVLDEPTNDLDGPSRRALRELLDAWSGGLLVASHDRALLEGMDRIVELSPLGLREYGGGWTLYRELRDQERAAARAALDQARTERKRTRRDVIRQRERVEAQAARGRRTRGDGSQPAVVLEARRERSEGTARRHGETGERLLGQAAARVERARARVLEREEIRVELGSAEVPAGKVVVRMEGVGWWHPGAGAPVLHDVSLLLRGPERVAVTGPNGAGKSSLLHLVSGRLRPKAGTVERGLDGDRVAYLDQAAGILGRGRTVLEAVRALHPDLGLTEARHLLARFLFPGDAALAPVETLSGGERMRAALACVLGGTRVPGLLLLDEPTNHLDLDSLETVEEAVAEYDGALLVVSHDPTFIEGVGVQRTLALGS